MTPSQSTALLPCPFCNGAAELRERGGWSGVGCNTTQCPALLHALMFKTAAEAVSTWNRRAAATLRGMEKEGPSPDDDTLDAAIKTGLQELTHSARRNLVFARAKDGIDVDYVAEPTRRFVRKVLAVLAQATPHTDHPAPFARGSWQHAVDDQLVCYGKTSEEFASPQEAVKWLLHVHGDAAITCAMTAAAPAPQGMEAQSADIYVECRECADCGHAGINDDHPTDARCGACGWSGPSPKEDRCPECAAENVMGAACPKCSGRYTLVAGSTVRAAAAPAQSTPTKEKENGNG